MNEKCFSCINYIFSKINLPKTRSKISKLRDRYSRETCGDVRHAEQCQEKQDFHLPSKVEVLIKIITRGGHPIHLISFEDIINRIIGILLKRVGNFIEAWSSVVMIAFDLWIVILNWFVHFYSMQRIMLILVVLCHSERSSQADQMLLDLSFLLVIMAVTGWDLDDNMSLAGLMQESREVDITTISSDDESINPEENFRQLLKGAHKLSSTFSQVSHFDDKIFPLSHGSTSAASELEFSGSTSNSMASSMAEIWGRFM